MSKTFHKYLIRNDFKQIRFHDLRHTNATLMLKNNVPAKVASDRLGHSSIKVTMDIYAHTLIEAQKEAAQTLDNFLND